MQKIDVVKSILSKTQKCNQPCLTEACAFAPTNIALCKYWGKRDEELNLPTTSSLSITIPKKGAKTKIKIIKNNDDVYFFNGKEVEKTNAFAVRLKNFLDLFRNKTNTNYHIETELNIPISAGLASSACGFAALVLALNELHGFNLEPEKLSILARLGSGSACRSLWPGFVLWQKGTRKDGMDSFGHALKYIWPELRIGLLVLSSDTKKIPSRQAMLASVLTSPLYKSWQKQAPEDLTKIEAGIIAKNFISFGETVENNAKTMHEVILKSIPPIDYFTKETHATIFKVKKMRKEKLSIFYTQDAGPNIILLFLEKDTEHVRKNFPTMSVIAPFIENKKEEK